MQEMPTLPRMKSPPRAQREQRRAEKAQLDAAEAHEEIADVRNLMSTQEGRRNVCRLFERAGILYGDLDVNGGDLFNPNAMTLAKSAGARDVVGRLDWIIRRYCSVEWNQMLIELDERQQLKKKRLGNDE